MKIISALFLSVFLTVSFTSMNVVNADDRIDCDVFNREPEKMFLKMLVESTDSFKENDEKFTTDKLEKVIRARFSCLNDNNDKMQRRIFKEKFKGKTAKLSFYLQKIRNQKSYAIEIDLDPPSAKLEQKVYKVVKKLKAWNENENHEARWIILAKQSPNQDLCSAVTALAFDKYEKRKCPSEQGWKGEVEIGTKKIESDEQGGRSITVWAAMTKKPYEYMYALVCIEKVKGACTRANVRYQVDQYSAPQ